MSTSSFVWMSDVHYDPHFGTSKAFRANARYCGNATTVRYGCDAPWTLIQSGIQAVASHNPVFVVVTGDYSRHGLDQVSNSTHAVSEIVRKVTMELQTNLSPETIILPVLGNNDVLPDYYLDVVDRKSSQLESIGDTLLVLNVLTHEEASLFRYGGYYARTIGQVRLLCLNTVIYSIEHTPKLPSYNTDPYDQFTWMDQELQTNENVYILGHIPPTISSYRHDNMWDEKYRLIFEQIVQKHASKIKAQLFGHFHTNEFRIFSPDMCLFIGPSITPVYNSNPAFQVIHYQISSGQLEDMDTYVFNISGPATTNWTKLNSFVQEYELDDLTPSSIQKGIIDPLRNSNQTVLKKFLFNFKSGFFSHSMQACLSGGVDSCSKDWLCTLRSNTNKNYMECMNTGHEQADTTKILLASSGVVVLLVFLCLYLPCCQRRAFQYNKPSDETILDHGRTVPPKAVAAEEHEII